MFRRRMIGLLASVALAVTGAGVMALPASATAPPMPMVATVEPTAAAAPGAGIAARAGIAPQAAGDGPFNCTKAPTIPVGPGSTGPSVRYLQCMLNSMWFGGSHDTLGPTGHFGNLTTDAVWRFKTYAFGKATDAIVGPTTWTVLITTFVIRSMSNFPVFSPASYRCPTAAHPVLTRGSTGASVVMLQCLLIREYGIQVQVDGIFGLRTWNAVLELKRHAGKPATDGIVGPATWDILLWNCQCGG